MRQVNIFAYGFPSARRIPFAVTQFNERRKILKIDPARGCGIPRFEIYVR
jgi:hypothetical protein